MASCWRKQKKSLSERIDQYLTINKDDGGDVCFLIGPESKPEAQVKIRAFKAVLIVQSEVFEKMFSEKWTQSQSSDSVNPKSEVVVTLVDVKAEAFRLFLKLLLQNDAKMLTFLQNENCDIDQVLDILYISTKYCVDCVSSACSAFLRSKLDVQNALKIYKHSHLLDDLLGKFTFKFILEKIEEIGKLEDFLHVDKNTMSKIVESDELQITEIKLFRFLCRWGEFCCEQEGWEKSGDSLREIFGGMLYDIRFPVMTPQEFALCCALNILNNTEALELYQYICSLNDRKNPVKVNGLGFNTAKRSSMVLTFDICRETSTILTYYGMGKMHSIIIESSKPLKVVSLGFFGLCQDSCRSKLVTYQFVANYPDVGNTAYKKVVVVEPQTIFHVPLNPPFIIEPGKPQPITFNLKGAVPLQRSKMLKQDNEKWSVSGPLVGGSVISISYNCEALAQIRYSMI